MLLLLNATTKSLVNHTVFVADLSNALRQQAVSLSVFESEFIRSVDFVLIYWFIYLAVCLSGHA